MKLDANRAFSLKDDHTLQLNVGDLKQNRQFVHSDIFIKVLSESREITQKWSFSLNIIVKDRELKLANQPIFEECFEETDNVNADIVVVQDFIENIL